MGIQYVKLYQLLSKYDFPEFVKKATVEEVDVPEEGIPQHLYADDIFSLYPCHTKAATLVSAAQFREDQEKYSDERKAYIENNLRSHAEQLGVASYVHDILTRQEPRREVYALEMDGRFLFPIRNERETKTAAAYLIEHWRELSSDIRTTVARNILKEAEEQNYNLGPYKIAMEKFAGYAIVDKKALYDRLRELDLNIPPGDKLEREAPCAVERLITAVELTSASDQRRLREIVKLASDIAYDVPQLKEPFEFTSTISVTEIERTKRDLLFLKNGSIYPIKDLCLDAGVLREWFPTQFDSAFVGNKVLLYEFCKKASQLSEEEANRIDDMFSVHGVQPLVRQSRAKAIPGL